MGHKVQMYENLLDMLDREIGIIEKKGELDEKSLDNLFKLTTSVKAVEKRIEKEEEKEQEKGSSGNTSFARGRRSRDIYGESMDGMSTRPMWMYDGEFARESGESYDGYGQSNRRGRSNESRESRESRERGGSRDNFRSYQSRRSYDRGYARDAAREQILGRLERLMDDATSETDRMAIEDCINKIEQ